MSYKIGSFNCRNFCRDEKKDIDIFAKIIREENLDIIALQEIRSKAALNSILYSLNCGGHTWEGFHEQDSITRTKSKYFEYGFIWNTKKLSLPHQKNLYYPRICKQYRRDRHRGQIDLRYEPLFGRFQTVFGPKFEIRIIDAHIMYSKGNTEVEDGIDKILMRRNELDILAKSIYTTRADKIYGDSYASTAFTILLGDYNLNKKGSGAQDTRASLGEYETIEISDGNKSKKISTEQLELTTLKRTPTDNNLYSNNFDHITFDKIHFDDVNFKISRINAVGKYCNNDFEMYREKVSDHLPIMIEIEFNKRRPIL